jgi:hypothetical protein
LPLGLAAKVPHMGSIENWPRVRFDELEADRGAAFF